MYLMINEKDFNFINSINEVYEDLKDIKIYFGSDKKINLDLKCPYINLGYLDKIQLRKILEINLLYYLFKKIIFLIQLLKHFLVVLL